MTTSWDGFIHLYSPDLKLLRKEKAPGGEQPYFARFSPDGTRIAVGYNDTTRVDVMAADNLRFLYQADTDTVANGDLSKVAWSADGWFLYAGGRYADGSGRSPVRRWADGGRGGFSDCRRHGHDHGPEAAAGRPFGGRRRDPLVAALDADGHAVWRKTGEIADFRGQRGQWSFGVSADGQVVRFGFEPFGKRPAEFSFRDLPLAP